MKYPILMADIIDSRKADSAVLINNFKKIIHTMNSKWKDAIVSPLTITLGDEFQGVIKDLENCYRIMFDIEESIVTNSLDIKLRYVMNYGEIDTPVNREIAYEMLGYGLTYAREQLTNMKSGQNRFRVIFNNKQPSSVINNLFSLYGSYVDSWKPNEYEIVSEFLKNKDYKVVASKLGMNKSSAWRRYKSLHIEEYNTIKDLILTLNKIL